jgi:hypothetical protein
MVVFDRVVGSVQIRELDIRGKEFKDIRTPLEELWG